MHNIQSYDYPPEYDENDKYAEEIEEHEFNMYHDIWSLSFKDWKLKYPNEDMEQERFNEIYKQLGQEYADAMQSIESASH